MSTCPVCSLLEKTKVERTATGTPRMPTRSSNPRQEHTTAFFVPSFQYLLERLLEIHILSSSAATLIPAYTTALDEAALQIGLITTLLVYEYIITFDQEVNLFWRRKITGATVLFITTRYLVLISFAILSAVTFAWMTVESCTALQRAQYMLSLFLYPLWATFSALRTLALSGMNRVLAAVVFALAMTPFVVDMLPLILHNLTGENIPLVGCAGAENVTDRQRVIYVALARGTLIASDLLVVGVTWTTWRRGRDCSITAVVPTLSSILMYNGTLYFLVVGICSTAHLVLTLLSIESPLERYSMITALTDPITAILVCRFLLALQRANQAALGKDTLGDTRTYGEVLAPGGLDAPRSGTLRFVSAAIGSIGESLEHHPSTSTSTSTPDGAVAVRGPSASAEPQSA
ncbi:hypothetical protein BC628DRAFT_1398083 [Trametes gibbosa]|nr:hypothetical protein BC628DRAFT_1398083 [Trametes gibbosa]